MAAQERESDRRVFWPEDLPPAKRPVEEEEEEEVQVKRKKKVEEVPQRGGP